MVAFKDGRKASQIRDAQQAIAAYTRSLGFDPEGSVARQAREQLAWALWHEKRYDEATDAFTEALSINPHLDAVRAELEQIDKDRPKI